MISRRRFLAGVAWTAPIVLAACAGSDNPATEPTGGGATTSSFVPRPTVGPPAEPSTSAVPTDAPTTAPVVAATTATTGGPAAFIDHGDATSDMVALTFHLSGPPATVTAMLDLLHQRGVTVTAFAVGTWITANPEITKRLVADGHELGNHTEHHLEMSTLTSQQIGDEIVECGQAIMPFIGSIGRWFRPSATVVPTQVILDAAGKAGYPVSVGYDIDSVDNKDPGAAAIVANVNPKLHGGGIVSLHFGHPGTITALPQILDELAARRLRAVTVGTLLG
ncbi:MAG: polysaccharide deacetylase family protein [Ilumatobacteraceae bacterium]